MNVCPSCSGRGESFSIDLYQINPIYASYFCSNEMCTFPGLSQKRFPVIRRSANELPVPYDLIRKLNLPEMIIFEKNLKMSDLPTLLEFKSLLPHAESILNSHDTSSLLSETIGKYKISNKYLIELDKMSDPDYNRLKNLVTQIEKYLKYFDIPPAIINRLLS